MDWNRIINLFLSCIFAFGFGWYFVEYRRLKRQIEFFRSSAQNNEKQQAIFKYPRGRRG